MCVEREKILSMCVLGKERTSKGMCDFPEKKDWKAEGSLSLPDGYFIVLELEWSSVVFKQSFAL